MSVNNSSRIQFPGISDRAFQFFQLRFVSKKFARTDHELEANTVWAYPSEAQINPINYHGFSTPPKDTATKPWKFPQMQDGILQTVTSGKIFSTTY